MEVMGVLHVFPIFRKGHLVYFIGILRLWIRNGLDRSALVFGLVFGFQFLINLQVAFFLHVNLHDGVPGLIKKLETFQRSPKRFLLYGKTIGPGGKEDTLFDRAYYRSYLKGGVSMDFYFLKIALVFED